MRNTFQKFIKEYFEERKQLVNTFVLVDARHEPQKIDLDFMEYLGENGIPFAIVFTKADKLNKSALPKNIANYKRIMLQTWEELPPTFITSSTTQDGKKELLEYIDSVNKGLS